MSFMNDYLREKEKLTKSSSSGNNYSSSDTKPKGRRPKSLRNFMEEYETQLSALGGKNDDIAPLTSGVESRFTVAPLRKEVRTWLQTPEEFEDGFDLTDLDDWKAIPKVILGTGADLYENATAGLLGLGEQVVDAGAYVKPYLDQANFYLSGAWLVPSWREKQKERFAEDKERAAEFIAKDLYDEEAVAKFLVSNPIKWMTGADASEDSLLGEKSDSLTQSAGQLVAQMGLQGIGIPWWFTSGATSFGSEAENALRQGATYEQAGLSGAITAGAEILFEKLFGGDVFTGKTGSSLMSRYLTTTISDKTLRTLAKFGIDTFGEGAEEVISQVFSNLGTSLYREESLGEILGSEKAFDEYLESFVGGAVLGGGMSGIQVNQAKHAGVDYTSGLTENEETEAIRIYEESLAEQGKKPNIIDRLKTFDSAIDSVKNDETFYDPEDAFELDDNMVEDDFAPTPENHELQRLIDERQALQDAIMESVNNSQLNGETENLAKQWSIVNSKIESMQTAPKTAETVETHSPEEKAQKRFRDSAFDFDKLYGLDTVENRAQYKAVVNATVMAQDFISKGTKGVKSISDIFSDISNNGNYELFEKYAYHLLNIDRASLDTRFGLDNKYVFGPNVTAEVSQGIVDEIEASHPEFKAVLKDVYAFNEYLLDLQVQGGLISPETANKIRERYPHFVHITRSRWRETPSERLFNFINHNSTKNTESDRLDSFLAEVEENAPYQEITSMGDDLNPIIDSMVDLALRTFWGVAKKNSGASPNAPIDPNVNIDQNVDAEDSFEPGTIPEKTEAPAEPAPPRRDDLMDNRMGPVKLFETFILDDGYFAEKISKKTGNRKLESLWHARRNARSKAQHIIGKGADGVRALTDIMAEVDKAGLTDEFSAYMWHQRNIDGMTLQSRYGLARNKNFIKGTSAAKSMAEVRRLETVHPEFRKWAQDCYDFTGYFINQYVERGILSSDDGEVIKEIYPHFIPFRTKREKISRPAKSVIREQVKQGILSEAEAKRKIESLPRSAKVETEKITIQPFFETMAQFAVEAENIFAQNAFSRELEGTLHTLDIKEVLNIEDFIHYIDYGIPFLKPLNLHGDYACCFLSNSELASFQITKEMFLAMQPGGWMDVKIPVFSHVSEFMRKATTEYDVFFALNNMGRDPQEILFNSQHPAETYATLISGEALNEMVNKGKFYQEYIENGGEPLEYFDPKQNKFESEKVVSNAVKRWTGLELISNINNRIETQPRLAEYIASRKLGKSIEEAMLNSARVTTNFAAGGKFTKFLNRNGCTFLNASVQGTLQHYRNFKEATTNGVNGAKSTPEAVWKGFTGWASMAARYVGMGLAASALNKLYWDDDEDYQELPDYITDNYYLVWKTDDGQFIRLPKGRTNVVIENAIKQVAKMSEGDDQADWNEFFRLFLENMAPNDPMTDNIFAPILEVANNKTWYGEDLVPKRLQDEPVEEQFDEKTDSFSIMLGDLIGVSPKKINYLINAYTGVIGDVLLPFGTPKAESPTDSFVGKLISPLRDIFSTDSTLNNRVTGDFYDTLEKAESDAGFADATPEDVLKSQFLISNNVEISRLLQEQRDIQTSDLPDSEKYEQTRAIKEEINDLMKKALEECEDIEVDGVYAEVGDRRYNYDATTDRWYEITPKKKNGEDNGFYTREQNVTKAFGLSYADYWNNKEGYDNAFYIASGYDNELGGEDSTMATVKHVFGIERFASFAPGLADIKADYDDDGNVINGSRRKKLLAYLDSLDIPEEEKYILFKAQYDWDNSHNYEIVAYLNGRDDISYKEMNDILLELGFNVDSEGNITW